VAHYDSRIYADHDPDQTKRQEPVPGANDGASGVAVLLELARTLPSETVPVWLVFFDAEDNGKIPGWDWILGSRLFVKTIHIKPQAVIVVDMVGDNDLNIYMEEKSDPDLTKEIWQLAQEMGYSQFFIKEIKHNIIDDHIPFIEAGIPAVDIIDIDYPYWHTTSDTNDKVSAQSLEIVGSTLWTWIVNYNLAESD
jgi:Zn-dependent M28 family amino/carboxypeptidase